MTVQKHRRLDQRNVEIMIHYEVGRLPPYLLLKMRSKDRTERASAIDEIAARISARFEPYEIFGTGEPGPEPPSFDEALAKAAEALTRGDYVPPGMMGKLASLDPDSR